MVLPQYNEDLEMVNFNDVLCDAVLRIADAQEALLKIAEDARKERNSLADQMKKAFQQPLQEK